MMRILIATLCLYSSVSLYAEEKELNTALQKKVLEKPENDIHKKRKFIFKESYDSNGIGLDTKEYEQNKYRSKSFHYQNSARFKFQFSPGHGHGNMANGAPKGRSMGSSGARRGGGRR